MRPFWSQDARKLLRKAALRYPGSYDSDSDYPCYWTNSDSHFGIHKHGDKGEYKQGGKSGHKADLKAGDMKGDFYRDYASWIMKDGHLDLDI